MCKLPEIRIGLLEIFKNNFSLAKSVTDYRIDLHKVHFRGVLLLTSCDFVADFTEVDLMQLKLSKGT